MPATVLRRIPAIVVVVGPFLWILMSSFKNRVDIFSSTPKVFFTPTLNNYVVAKDLVFTAHPDEYPRFWEMNWK